MRVIQVEHVNGQKPSSLIRAGNHPQTLMRETTKKLSAERWNSMHSGRPILQIQCCSSAVLYYRYRWRWKRHNDTRNSQQHSARKIVLHMVHMALEPSFLASSASHHVFLMRKHWATDSVPRYPALGFPTCYRISSPTAYCAFPACRISCWDIFSASSASRKHSAHSRSLISGS